MKQKLFFLLALLCVMVQGVFADKWDGFSTSKPAWDGSAAVIKTAAELAYIRDHWQKVRAMTATSISINSTTAWKTTST